MDAGKEDLSMQRWEFRAGCILMGWSAVEAALELRTSIGTIMKLEDGPLDEVIDHEVAKRAQAVFRKNQLAIAPSAYGVS